MAFNLTLDVDLEVYVTLTLKCCYLDIEVARGRFEGLGSVNVLQIWVSLEGILRQSDPIQTDQLQPL